MSEKTITFAIVFGIPWLLLGMRILESHWNARHSAAPLRKSRAASARVTPSRNVQSFHRKTRG